MFLFFEDLLLKVKTYDDEHDLAETHNNYVEHTKGIRNRVPFKFEHGSISQIN